MYNNPYLSNFNSQMNIDRINGQINELQKMKEQMQQMATQPPTNLTQNFQLAPSNKEVIRYSNSKDDVEKEVVFGDTPYFSKDMSVVWIKNAKGDIKTYALNEIVPKDEKDIKIEYLQAQIEELKKGIKEHESNAIINGSTSEPNYDEEPSSVSKSTRTNKKHK